MAGQQEIDGATAWRNLLGAPSSRWSDGRDPGDPESAHARIARGLALPQVAPKFRLREDDVYFCIGSCFARNVEEHLIYRRLPVLSRAVPFGDRNGRPNGIVNKFTVGSILNELRWSLAGEPFPEDSLVEENGAWRDLHLAERAPAAPLETVRARREQVRAYFGRLREASVVIVTLGLVETWYDAQAGVMLNAAPTPATIRRFPDRFRLLVTDAARNAAMLHEIVALLNRHVGSAVRIVVSVSPVPMSETFTGRDVLVANAYSKAALRVAADEVARAHDNVDYYPSYEAVTVSHRTLAYNPGDDLHVLDAAVRAVCGHFLTAYGAGGAAPDGAFVELDYLWANPDVHQAVLEQRFTSGYEHWLAHGRDEGRPLRAAERPVPLQRLVGP